jgi:hypothetical protein
LEKRSLMRRAEALGREEEEEEKEQIVKRRSR